MYPCTDSIRGITPLAGDLLSIIIALPVWLTYACGSAAKRDTKRNAAGQSLPGDEQKEYYLSLLLCFFAVQALSACVSPLLPRSDGLPPLHAVHHAKERGLWVSLSRFWASRPPVRFVPGLCAGSLSSCAFCA
jgi:hypothetical protein